MTVNISIVILRTLLSVCDGCLSKLNWSLNYNDFALYESKAACQLYFMYETLYRRLTFEPCFVMKHCCYKCISGFICFYYILLMSATWNNIWKCFFSFLLNFKIAFSIKITLKREELCVFRYLVDHQVQIIYAKSV